MDNKYFDSDRANQANTLQNLVERRKRNEALRNPAPESIRPNPDTSGHDDYEDTPVFPGIRTHPDTSGQVGQNVFQTMPTNSDILDSVNSLRGEVANLIQLIIPLLTKDQK